MRYSILDGSREATEARILLEAVIQCAKAGVNPPSFFLKKMIWGVSLYLECGNLRRENWRVYHRASDEAKKVRASGDKNWKKRLTFEHVRPLSQIYQMLLGECDTLTLERAAVIVGEYPPVLITTDEERHMASQGFKSDGAPEQRYAGISISGFSLLSDGRSLDNAVRRS